MPLRRASLGELWPVLLAPAIVGLWALTAYAMSPLPVPGALVAAAFLVAALRRPELGMAVALVLVPLQDLTIGVDLSGTEGSMQPLKAAIPPLAAGLALYSALGERRSELNRWARAVTIALVLFLLVAIMSSLQAIEPDDSIRKLVLLLTAAALYAAVRMGCRERRQVLTVCAGAVAGLLVTSVYAVGQQALGSADVYTFTAGGELVGRATGAFEHPASLGYYLAVLAPLAAGLALTRETPTALRQLSAVAAALAVPALVLAYSRSALLAVVAAPVIWLMIVRPRKAAVAIGVAVVGVALALLAAPASVRDRFDPQQGSQDVELRQNVWGAGFDIYSQHPLLGAGVNNFPNAYATLPQTAANTFRSAIPAAGSRVTPSNAHDGYLNTLAEEGIVGLASLLLLMAAAAALLYRGARLADPVGRRVAIGVGIGATAWAVINVVDTSMITEATTANLAMLAVVGRFVELDGTAAGEDGP